MGFFFSKTMRNILILYIMFSGIQYLLQWKTYTISPKEFRSIADKVQGVSASAAIGRLTSDLQRAYGPTIVANAPWNALALGGMSLKAAFIHASITEYVAVFGTPFATSGRIGMHWSNNTCTVLTGTVQRVADGVKLAEKETFNSGGNFRHGQFESHTYAFAEDTYVACYGRGVIPISGLWAVTGSISQGEPLSLFHMLYTFGEASLSHTLLSLNKTFQYYKGKATGKSEL